MSTRTNLRPQIVIEDGDMSDDIVSDPTIMQSLTRISYAVTWSASTAIGELSIEASNDYAIGPNGAVINAGTWTTIYVEYAGAAVASVPVAGSSGTAFIDGTTGAYAVRLVYAADSGAGSLAAVVNGKVS